MLMRATLFEATARRRYERELLSAQRAAEESEARSRTVQRVVSDLAAATSVADVAAVDRRARPRGAGRAGGRAGAGRGGPGRATCRGCTPSTRRACPSELLHELRAAAIGQLALELAQGVRTVTLDDRLRAERPAVAAAMAADGLSSLVLVPVTADSRRLGVLVLGLGRRRQGDLISLDEPGDRRGSPGRRTSSCSGRWAGRPGRRWSGPGCTRRPPGRRSGRRSCSRRPGCWPSAADVAETVERLAALAVERLADLCAIDLTTEQRGRPRRRCGTATPRGSALAEELRQRQLAAAAGPAPGAAGAAAAPDGVGAGARRRPAASRSPSTTGTWRSPTSWSWSASSRCRSSSRGGRWA